jgi:hypothetical protein
MNGVPTNLDRPAEQTFSNDRQEIEEHGDMEYRHYGTSPGDCDGDGDGDWLDIASEVADDDVEMERQDETDDEAVMMMEEMYS